MIKGLIKFSSTFILLLLLSGCGIFSSEYKGATKIASWDADLIEYYSVVRANPESFNGEGYLAAKVAYPDELVNIANAALAEITVQQKKGNQKNVVALYRIAVTALWYAGPDHRTALQKAIGDNNSGGIQACNSLKPGGGKDQPRDCALISLAEPLAFIEDSVLNWEALVVSPPKQPGRTSVDTAGYLTQGDQILQSLSNNSLKIKLFAQTLETDDWKVPERFYTYLHGQFEKGFCHLVTIFPVLLRDASPPQDHFASIVTAIAERQKGLEVKNLPPIDCSQFVIP